MGVKILNKLNKKGFKAYIVGGSVRDIVLGDMKPHDVDIATNASMDDLSKLFKLYDIGKSKDFGVVIVKEGGFQFEVTQFREDGTYKDGRRPDSIKITGSFEEDAARRDFTINAMGINAKGDIIDYFTGKSDIKNKILRTVGDPRKRFKEDSLRMMRAPRFASKLGFDISKGTEKAIQKQASDIVNLSPSRIYQELIKSASQSGEKFAKYILLLDKLKLLKHILPEVANLKWFRENLKHHPETRGSGGTVFSHVMAALKQSNTKNPIKNLSILLHDVGKGVTFSQKEGLPRYLGHAKASMNLVIEIAKRLKMSNQDRDALIFSVSNHMKFHDLLKMKNSKIAKLVNDGNWDVLVAVARADEYARGSTFRHAGEFEKIVDKAIKIKQKFGMATVNNQLKLVDGKYVMKLTGLKPGPAIGDIIINVTKKIMDDNVTDKDEINNIIVALGNKHRNI